MVLSGIRKSVGLEVSVHPEWGFLWNDLKPLFDDPSNFVPFVATVVTQWAKIYLELTSDEGDPAWTERMLQEVGKSMGDGINLRLEVSSK
jgi:hypothetical protein